VALLGLGLIGGSVAAAIRVHGLAESVTAFDRSPDELSKGLSLGLIDEAADSLAQAVTGADLVIIAVPVLAIGEVLRQIGDFVSPAAIITDVGSVKVPVIAAARQYLPELLPRVVPGHPIAGSEQHGVVAANGDLFLRHKVILTPVTETDSDAIERLSVFWEALGSEVLRMSPEHHDSVLAQTSHLPHLLAYGLIDTLSQQGDSLEIFDYAAGGLRDFSRIAASDPVMWRDIYQANSGPVLAILDRYMHELLELRTMIATSRFDELAEVFGRAKLARDHFSKILNERAERATPRDEP
jgi:3-phosphoshikimate 1-carboxyvinyltransferase